MPSPAQSSLTVRAIHEDDRSCDFVASTDCVDSYGEIVEQTWILDRYKANPVVLFAHDSRSMPIGHATRIAVVKGALECTIQFSTIEANPLAEQAWQSVKQKALRTVSVGFCPGEVRCEKRDGQEVYVLAQNDLHEISLTPLPANPEALAKMRARAREAAHPAPKDTTMPTYEEKDFLAIRATLEAKDAELTTAKKDLEAARAKAATLEVERAALTTERDAALARAKKAEAEVVERDIDALVGVKIVPAEKEALVELAAAAPAIFQKQLAALRTRDDMTTLKRAMTVPAAGALPPAGGSDLSDVNAAIDAI